MAADLRPDIAAAKARLRGGTFGSGRELKRLPDYLADGENVLAIAAGAFGGGQGLLALTPRRLLFLVDGVTMKRLEDFPLDRVSSVAWSSGLVLGSIMITVAGNRAVITNVGKSDGREFVDEARAALTAYGTAAAVPAAASTADELGKLAALRAQGVLTEDEFAAAKARLIG